MASKRKAGPAVPTELVIPPVEGAEESITGAGISEPAAEIQPSGQMVTMYAPDGTSQQVDAAQAPELYRQQKLGFAEGQKINVTRGGKVYEFEPGKLDAAFENGYRVASDEEVTTAKENKEFSGVGKTAEAFGFGLARGGSFGLSDPLIIGAAGAIGGEQAREKTRRELRLSKEKHAVASIGGEVLGALAPVVLTGGAGAAVEGAEVAGTAARTGGLLSRAVRTAGFIPRAAEGIGAAAERAGAAIVGEGATGLAGRVLQRAVPSALKAGTEGALFGMGGAVSEASLGNEELTAEKLYAGAKSGFKMGFFAGGVLGGGYEIGKAAVDKGLKIIGKEGLEEFLKDVSRSQVGKALGTSAQDYKNLAGTARSAEQAEARMGEIADTTMNYKFADGRKLFKGGMTQAKLADNLAEAAEESGRKLGAFRNKAAELSKADVALSPDVKGFFQKLDTELIEPALAKEGTTAKRAQGVLSEFTALRKKVIPAGLPEDHPLFEVWQNAQAGNEQAARMIDRAATLDASVAKLVKPEAVGLDELQNVKEGIDEILFSKKRMGIQAPVTEHHEMLLEARQMLEQTIENETDRIVEAVGNPEMKGMYSQLKQTTKNLIEGREISAAADLRAASRNTASLSDKMAGGSVLAGMLAKGVAAPQALLGSMAAGMVNKAVNARANTFIAEAADKMSKLVAMQKVVHASDHHVAEGLNAFLGEHHELHQLAHQIEHTAFEAGRTAQEVKQHVEHEAAHELASDPHAMATHVAAITSGIAEHAPNVASHVQTKAEAVAQNVSMEAQQGHHSDETVIPAPKPVKSAADIHHIKSYQTVAEGGPVEVVRAMQSGSLTPTKMRAVEQNYPKWTQELKLQTLDKLASGAKPSYEKRKQLGIFLGAPVDATQTPQFKQSMQQIYQPKQPGAGGPKPSRRPATKLAAGQLTPNQKLE